MKKVAKNRNSPTELTVGEVAARSGVAVSAIHFYEDKGLIAARRAAGRRRYSAEDLQRVVIIKTAQRVGTPLSVVRELLQFLPKDRPATAQDWIVLLDRWGVDIDQRIARLTGRRKSFDHCIDCACLSFESCPLIAPATGTRSERAPPAR